MNFINHNLNIIPLDIYIDPPYPVNKAIITHAHADHAKPGHGSVLATKETIEIMKIRYGQNCAKSFQVLDYGKTLSIDSFKITLYPAGHILGSSQVLIKNNGHRVLITGDYKTVKDSTCKGFELIKCETLITEATFGLPVFIHPKPQNEIKKILSSLRETSKNHLVGVYALGKAQRFIKLLREAGYDNKIYIHGSLKKICEFYQNKGIDLGLIEQVTRENDKHIENNIILAPPSALRDRWSRRIKNHVSCRASGWMAIKQRVKQNLVELPLIISDHSDWNELTSVIKNSTSENVWVTHGREDALVYWCKKNNLNSRPLAIKGREEDSEL